MKETIYTIPLSESLEENAECPFCFLENKLEEEQIEYALGPAMMEPDHRIRSNALGYCRRHTKKMAESRRALPFALVFDTRVDTVIETLENAKEKGSKKGGLFSKKASEGETVLSATEALLGTCLVCDKLEHTLEKFMETFWYLYDKEPDFKQRILESKGICLPHFRDLLKRNKIGGAKKEQYEAELIDLVLKNLKRHKEEVHGFVKQFDYRSNKEDATIPKDAHTVCAGKLSKF